MTLEFLRGGEQALHVAHRLLHFNAAAVDPLKDRIQLALDHRPVRTFRDQRFEIGRAPPAAA